MSLSLSKVQERTAFLGTTQRTTACEAHDNIGQVQNFDSNSRWVPMLSRAGHLANRAPRSRQASPEDRQTEPNETPRQQLAQARAFFVTRKCPAVIDTATATPPHDAMTSVARSAPGEALSVRSHCQLGFVFVSSPSSYPRSKGGQRRANKIHPQKLRFRLSRSPFLVAERKNTQHPGV